MGVITDAFAAAYLDGVRPAKSAIRAIGLLLDASKLNGLASITALRAESAPEQPLVWVEGYAHAGDGGEGWFRHDPDDGTSGDNGGTVILAGSACWKRVFKGSVSPRWFGAVNEGSAGDSGAIRAAIAAHGGAVYDFGAGHTYKIDKQLNLLIGAADGARFVGASNLVCGAADLFIFYCSAKRVTWGEGLRLTNPTGYGQTNRLAGSTSGGIYIDQHAEGCEVVGLDIENFVVGILRFGYDGAHPVNSCRYAMNRVSVLPWDMTAAAFTASISGTTMTVTAKASGSIVIGNNLLGSGVTFGTTVAAQLTGSPGGTGTYTITVPHTLSSRAMTNTATWANDGICVIDYSENDVIEANTVVVYSGAGIFNNFEGVSFTYARSGITIDTAANGALVKRNRVGSGFSTTLYNDATNTGVVFEQNTAYGGYYSTIAAGAAVLRDNDFRASSSTANGPLEAVVLLCAGGQMFGNLVAGGSASIVLVKLLNIGTGKITISSNFFSGLYLAGVSGSIASSFAANDNDWAGTCGGGTGNLYALGMTASTNTAAMGGDTQQAGLSYGSALNASPMYNTSITGENWAGATNSNINLLGSSSGVRIVANDLKNTHTAQACVLVSTGGGPLKPVVIIVANDTVGPTNALISNAAAADVGTNQILEHNTSNTHTTF